MRGSAEGHVAGLRRLRRQRNEAVSAHGAFGAGPPGPRLAARPRATASANARSSRAMSGPPGWNATSVTPASARAATRAPTSAAGPVSVKAGIIAAAPASSAVRSRALSSTRCPSCVARCRRSGGSASRAARHSGPPGRPSTAAAPPRSYNAVQRHGHGRARGLDDPRRVGGLALVEDRAEGEQRVPAAGGLGVGQGRREHAIGQLPGHRRAPGPVGAEEDRHVERSRRAEPVGVDHADGPAVPRRLLAAQQGAQGDDVGAHVVPAHGPLAEHVPAGEPGAEGDRHAARREVGEGGDGAGRDHGVAEARHDHRRAEPDRLGALGAPGQAHPDVVVEGGGVVEPGPGVAELLGQGDVGGCVPPGREGGGQRQGHRAGTVPAGPSGGSASARPLHPSRVTTASP